MSPPSVGVVGHPRFSEQDLADLLAALRRRAVSHPDNPGLVACWPTVPEDRMAAGCRELLRRGHPIRSVSIAGWAAGRRRTGWAINPE